MRGGVADGAGIEPVTMSQFFGTMRGSRLKRWSSPCASRRVESGRGLPQSKTLRVEWGILNLSP